MPPALSLLERVAIALVPSSVPALMLLIALGLALAIGDLPEFYEEIAGGALLITYIKELFPKVSEQGDACAQALVLRGASELYSKVYTTLIMVVCICAAVVGQDGLAGFPGMSSEREPEAEKVYTPVMTITYFVGFFVDGVVLAYDEEPIRCGASLLNKMVLSLVFAIDNFLDGFGLVPVYKQAYGEPAWLYYFIFNSACVVLGALATAFLLHYVPSPVVHLAWVAFATTFILIGAIQIMPNGLNSYVMIGVGLVWIVLFVGDLAEELNEEPHEDHAAEVAAPAPRELTLKRKKQKKYLEVVYKMKSVQIHRMRTAHLAQHLLQHPSPV